jgi:hypothetical protein
MSKERCHENAFCEVCRFGDFSGKCFAVESQREIVAHYGGYEQFELMSFCLDKDQRIAELEEQLKNAIVPKFKIGQEVWYIEDNQVNSATIDDMWIEFNGGIEHYFNLDLSDGFGLISKANDEKWEPHFGIGTYYVFGSEQEAEAKLKELGERK